MTLKKSHGVAKVFGSIIGVLGALVFAFVKGPSLINHYNSKTIQNDAVPSTKDSVKGSITMLAANTCWCLWIVLQVWHLLGHFNHFTTCVLILALFIIIAHLFSLIYTNWVLYIITVCVKTIL